MGIQPTEPICLYLPHSGIAFHIGCQPFICLGTAIHRQTKQLLVGQLQAAYVGSAYGTTEARTVPKSVGERALWSSSLPPCIPQVA